MLELLIVILLLCWLVGYPVLHLGAFVHVLLVVVLVLAVVRFAQGRRIM